MLSPVLSALARELTEPGIVVGVVMLLSEGHMSDHNGAALMLSALPKGKILIGDKGYDSNGFRQTLVDRSIKPCIPSRRSSK